MHKLITIVSVSLTVLWSTAHAQDLAKAKVEEPVLQELMGGCSLKCAFAWGVQVRAPGVRSAPVNVLNDDNAQTAWTAPPGTTGVGVKFQFLFPKKLPSELQGTPLYGLDLINGVWKSEEEWKAHGRVKKARLYYNDKPFLDVVFADSRRWQRVSFPDILVRAGDWMTLEILEVYPGVNNSGAAITEVVLQGAH
jgi:hypothetical protein